MHSRRKFRSQTSDNMDKWKSRGGKSQIREEQKTEDQRRERVRRKNMEVREKVEKSRFTVSCGSGGSKSRLAKAAVAEPPGQIRDEKLHTVVARSTFGSQNVQNTPKLMSKKSTPLCREAPFEVKMYKTHHVRTTFGSGDVEKVHAVVARSTFWSQNVQNTPGSGHFWKLRWWKSARRCGTNQKSGKNWGVRTTFGRSDAVLRGRHKGFCALPKDSKTRGFCSSFNYNRRYTTVHYITLQLQSTTLHSTNHNDNYNNNYTTWHYTTPLH